MPRETSRPRTWARILPQLKKCKYKSINSTPTTFKQSNAPGTPQMVPQKHLTWNHYDPPKGHVPHPKFTLIHNTNPRGPHLFHHPVPHQDCVHNRYLGGNCLIPQTDAEIMGGCRFTREVGDSLRLQTFPKKNLILPQYIISAWWFHLLYGLGNYFICPGAIEKVLVTTNNIMTLGYTYTPLDTHISNSVSRSLLTYSTNSHMPSVQSHGFIQGYPGLRHSKEETDSYNAPAPPPQHSPERTTRRFQPLLTILRGTCYGT